MDVLSFFYLVGNSDDVGASFGPVVYRTRGMWSGCTYNGWGWGGAMDYMQVSRKKELHMTFLYLYKFVQQQELFFAHKMYVAKTWV